MQQVHVPIRLGFLGFGFGQTALLARLGFVQGSECNPEPVTHFPALTGQVADSGLSAAAFLGDLHLCESPRNQVGDDLFPLHSRCIIGMPI